MFVGVLDEILIVFFYILNFLLLLSGLSGMRLKSGEHRLAVVIIQTLFFLPLLAGEYFYLSGNINTKTVFLVLFSEIIFTLIWFSLALRLRSATITNLNKSEFKFLIEIINSLLIAIVACYFLDYHSINELSDKILIFNIYSPAYFASVSVLISVIYAAWRMEQFWRFLNTVLRREYKFWVVGVCLTCGVMAWSASYRLTYLTIYPKHLQLLSAILLLSWLLMSYAVFRHRLLSTKVFVSRKTVYSFVIPSVIAALDLY